MKKIVLAVLVFVFVATVFSMAQSDSVPITWSGKATAAGPVKTGTNVTVTVTAMIDEGWHLYSITQPAGGPTTTTIKLVDAQPFKLNGTIKGSPFKKVYDENFSMNTELYVDRATFTVPVQATGVVPAGKAVVKLAVKYQVCNESSCLPPTTLKLEVPINAGKAAAPAAKKAAAATAKK